MRHDPLRPPCPFPAPSSTELWYPSSLHRPTNGRGHTRSIPPNQPNRAAEYNPSCNKSPEEPHWPLEEMRRRGGSCNVHSAPLASRPDRAGSWAETTADQQLLLAAGISVAVSEDKMPTLWGHGTLTWLQPTTFNPPYAEHRCQHQKHWQQSSNMKRSVKPVFWKVIYWIWSFYLIFKQDNLIVWLFIKVPHNDTTKIHSLGKHIL